MSAFGAAPFRLLIVDDQHEVRAQLRRVLAPLGCDIYEAADGGEALALCNRRKFELILTDVNMPKVDGMVLLEAVRSAGHDTDVLLISGRGSIGMAVLAMKRGAAGFLEKPVDRGELVSEVERLMQARANRAPAAPVQIEPRIGRYIIRGQLGRGGMGTVYDCHDPQLGRDVAVKTFDLTESDELDERYELIERFRREAHIVAGLNHPNIVTVHDFGEDRERGVLFLAMEKVEGRSVRQLLDEHDRLSLEQAITISFRTVDGLSAAHAANTIHRDIKPTNILVSDNDAVKLVDFGIAGIRGSRLTNPGMMVGSIYYMSPEMLRGKEIDHRLDQFGVGIVLFEMLTGCRLYVTDDVQSTIDAILKTDIPLLKDYGLKVPRRVQKMLSRLLAKWPAERYPTDAALLEELIAIGRKLGLNLTPAT